YVAIQSQAGYDWDVNDSTHGPDAAASEDPQGCPCPLPSAPISLTQLRPGETGTISGCGLDAGERRLLRAMGLRDEAKIVLCRLGEPCIVRVMGGCGCSSRIGLARPLAEQVFIRREPGAAPGV
ncbi:MAG: FeoA family protein, partial [Planctomycetota bacterium]|nr:FeoA family protein [Planctomycetota bacterium]